MLITDQNFLYATMQDQSANKVGGAAIGRKKHMIDHQMRSSVYSTSKNQSLGKLGETSHVKTIAQASQSRDYNLANSDLSELDKSLVKTKSKFGKKRHSNSNAQ